MSTASTDGRRGRSVLAFFASALVLTVPFLVIGEVTGVAILPGLPISALIAVCPAVAALLVVVVRRERGGVRGFLRAAFLSWPRGWWWLPTLLLMPTVMVASWIAQRVAGVSVPVPTVEVPTAVGLAVAFILAGVTEELGWSGYAINPLRDRWGAVAAGLTIGAVWVVFHVVPLLQAARPWAWIAWWALATISMRVIMVWLYEHTGRGIIGVSILHATYNLTWQLYPEDGSFYDPVVTGSIMAAVAVLVLVVWRPERHRAHRAAGQPS